jgi:branched-chain amino acid transport system permease protein
MSGINIQKLKTKNDLILLAGCAVLYSLVQGMIFTGFIGPFWQLNIILVCINIILVTSLNLINGFTGQFSIGHAGFMAVGAYVGAILTVKFHASFLVAILAGAAGAGLLGFLIGIPTLRLSGDYLAIATLGLGEIIRITILNIPYVGGASGFMGIPRYTTFTWAFWILVFTIFFIKNFVDSTHGRACISVRENEIAAEAMGIDTTKYKVLAFTIGAAFAGVAGCLFSHYFYIAHPASFTFMKSFDILTMVVLGGLGSISGSITAAILLTFVSAALASYPEWRMVIYSLALILLMIYRPQGLFGNKELSMSMLRRIGGRKHGTTEND